MTDNRATENVFLFLTGMAVGSATAFLLAPSSGRRVRRQFTRRVEDTQDYLTDVGEELIERGQELLRQRGRRAA